MIPPEQPITPDWKWGTSEGSREFDRLTDRLLTCGEILEWLEEAETLSLFFQAAREKVAAQNGGPPPVPPCPPS